MKTKISVFIVMQICLFCVVLFGSVSLVFANDYMFEHPVNAPQHENCLYGVKTCFDKTKYHAAIDYKNSASRDIVASNFGKIVYIEHMNANDKGMGSNVIIEHALSIEEKIYSSYSHLNSIELNLYVGKTIRKGEKIGIMGGSGRGEANHWDVHLHYEMKDSPVTHNPSGDGLYWGYTPNHPDNYGYHDPNDYIGKISVVFPVGEYIDGWHDDTHPQPSQPFLDCYNKNGGAKTFGIPWDKGEGVWVHEWPYGLSSEDTIFVQNFINWSDNGHWWQFMLNQAMNEAFPVHNQVLFFLLKNSNYLIYGEPICNEYFATYILGLDKLVIQEFEKNGVVRYIGYNTQEEDPLIENPREYQPWEFYEWVEPKFHHYQTTPCITMHNSKSFTIDGETYFAIANGYRNVNGNLYNVDSMIYKWNGSLFVEFQAIFAKNAEDWESFTIDGDMYLVVASSYQRDYNCDTISKIYKWDGASFRSFQYIQTSGAEDWESFVINGETYLAVANGRNNNHETNIDSKIYKWNGSLFVEFQAILTNRARDWKSFKIDGETYLAVVNSSYNSNSIIYKWDGTMFVEFQSILTYGAEDWESFVINGEMYLAVANSRNNDFEFDAISTIYKWNGLLFVEFQHIQTSGAIDWESFVINGETYLAVANIRDNNFETKINSKIYKWNGSLFVEFQSIFTTGAMNWENFVIGGKIYLIVSNSHNFPDPNNFKIYIVSNKSSNEEQMVIQQGETIAKPATIPEHCEQAEFSRIIKGSDVEMSLIAPDGTVINRETQDPNIQHALTGVYESYQIVNPVSGEWKIKLEGTDVPISGEDTTLVVSIQPEPNEPPIADAGENQAIILPTESETTIILNGSNSTDLENSIAKFEWYESDAKLGEGENLEISLTLGQHQVRLIVIDSAGNMDDDIVNISISMSGDFDLDSDVDGSDLAIFASDFGRTDCNSANPCPGDFNSDGNVNQSDLIIFAANFSRIN